MVCSVITTTNWETEAHNDQAHSCQQLAAELRIGVKFIDSIWSFKKKSYIW